MMISLVQQSTLEAAALVAQRKFYQASELVGCIMNSLYRRRNEFASATSDDKQKEVSLQVRDLVLVPVSKNYEIDCPEWDEEFFNLPFAFFVRGSVHADEEGKPMSDQVAATCAGTSLFNLALCYHLEAMRHGGNSAKALMNACNFYGQAWTCLKKFTNIASKNNTSNNNNDDYDEKSVSFLLMAICVNMSKCCYYMGELDASNEWLAALRACLSNAVTKDDALALELHNYFLMAATVNTGCIAAATA